MGRDLSGPEYFEGRLTAYLESYLKKLGADFDVVETAPGRCNVIARIDGDSRGATKTILMDAHQDTVPTDGMTIPPFEPTEKDGRVYGRGSCDVKGGLAAMLAAFTRLFHERPKRLPNVVLSMTCDEEATSLGIDHLVGSFTGGSPSYRVCPTKPDVVIVAEPTELDIVVAHRGATRWKIHTQGRACHSSRPSEGVNAIYRMARVLNVLEEFAEWLPGSKPAHQLCGPATLSVGLVSGGSSVNVVPDHCEVDIDRRVIPGEDSDAVQAELKQYLKERLDFDLIHDAPYCSSPALGDAINGPLADQLGQVIASVVGPRRRTGVPFGTHASRFAKIDVPVVVFGPGNIAQAHTKDEWISIDQLRQSAEIYYRFCSQFEQS
ncbi:MAG: M20 family metallopeptidase [Planctomycetes bacterium]|nr:M20 family metallopeptidase [Planctomycetota bacterium]